MTRTVEVEIYDEEFDSLQREVEDLRSDLEDLTEQRDALEQDLEIFLSRWNDREALFERIGELA